MTMKISISNLLNRRKKFNILLLALVLCLSAFMFSIATTKNARNTKAAAPDGCPGNICTISGAGTYDLGTNAAYDNKDIIIDGSTVIIAGSHTFNNLTIINNANLTHADFVSGDVISSNKKVDLIITNDLILVSGGKIDVSGKGYKGGVGGNYDGELRNGTINGGGVKGSGSFFAGGGAFIGDGGDGASNPNSGGDHYAYNAQNVNPNDLQVGSGGGSTNASAYPGGDGGGRIRINSGGSIQILSDNSYIAANGEKGNNWASFGWYDTGAGAGGSIWIDAPKLYVYNNKNFSSNGVSVNPGSVGSGGASSGTAGSISLNGAACSGWGNCLISSIHITNLYTKGGNTDYGLSGSGGGGYVYLNIPSAEFSCHIAIDGAIPASCENQDVIIDGATVNADAVKILTGTTTECSDPNNSGCDSKRHFRSLTIQNGAVLTHEAVIINDMYLRGDSLADETTGTGHWKKVDLIITNNLTLENGGKIDVNGKGYPNDYGPGHGLVAGQCPDEKGCAGGGGYGGEGGQGNSADLIGGKTYGSENNPIDFGSGAGLSDCGNDFFGGGRIKIDAGSITISDLSSMISANGNENTNNCDFSPGGPSGGSIWLIANTINTPAARLYTPSDYAMADKGYHRDLTPRGTDGFVGTLMINGVLKNNGNSNNPAVPSYTNIFAKGGDIWRNGGAGGGGRIVIGSASTSSSVKKVLEPLNRGSNPQCTSSGGENCFNPYSVQVGDKIRIHLYVTNLVPGSSNLISDELFKTALNDQHCEPVENAYSPGIVDDTYSNGKIEWNNVTTNAIGEEVQLYYDCLVK